MQKIQLNPSGIRYNRGVPIRYNKAAKLQSSPRLKTSQKQKLYSVRLVNRWHRLSIPAIHLDDPVLTRCLSMPSCCRSAIPPSSPPALGAHVGSNANTNAPGTLVAPRAPGPACTAGDRQVVPAEAEPGRGDANQATKDEIKAKVTEIGKARACDVDGGANGGEDQNERVDGRRSGLIADWDDVVFGICGRGERGVLLVDGEERALLEI
jgi:hypothetical protein